MTSRPSTPCTRPSSSTTAPSCDRAGQQVAERVAQGLVAAHRADRVALAAALPRHRPAALVADEREGQAVVDRPQVDLARAREGQALERAVGAHEVLDEVVGGVHEQLHGGRVLGQHAALLEHRDAVAELDRLVDVVGDEDDRLAQALLQAQQLVLEALAVDRVDGAEGLVHEHQRRVGGQGAGHADALALAAGELRGVAVARLGRVEPDELDELVDAGADALAGPAQHARHGGDVLGDRLVREEADLLDRVADLAAQVGGPARADRHAPDEDVAARHARSCG